MPTHTGTTIIVIESILYPDAGLRFASAIQVTEPIVNNPMTHNISLNLLNPIEHKNKPRAIKIAPKLAIMGEIPDSVPYTATVIYIQE